MRTVLSALARRLRRAPLPFGPTHSDARVRQAGCTAARAGTDPQQPSLPPALVDPAATNRAGSAAQPGDLRFANGALSRVILNYAPVLDRRYAVMGTRLTVHALAPVEPTHISDLLRAISQVWPEEAGHRVSLNMVGDTLARALIRQRPARNILIEVPASVAVARQSRQHLEELQSNGNLLQIKGYVACEVPAELLGCFQYAMAGLSEPVLSPTGRRQPLPELMRSDIRSLNGMRASFASGAIAITGWPMATPLQAARLHTLRTNSRAHVITELLRRINRGDPIVQLEEALSQDPTVAYKLLRYVNSAAFNLPVKIVAVRDAMAVLGRHKLHRWLVLTLAASGPHAELRPTTFAAMRRGVMMEELARIGGHAEWGDELFICGIFSLIDRMLGQPMRELLEAISPPRDVWRALIIRNGPYHPYLHLAQAIERGQHDAALHEANELGIPISEVNRIALKATAVVVQLK